MRDINAYTIGHKASYDRDLKDRIAHKVGRTEDYPGGWIWETREEAEAFLNKTNRMRDFGQGPRECDVYGLILPGTWEECSSPEVDAEGVHLLLVDAELRLLNG